VTNVREIAFEAILAVDKKIAGKNITKDILDKYSYLDKRDRAFMARLIEGTIERMITIDYVLDLYSKVPVRKMKPPVRSLLRLAVYQLLFMHSVPESAAVNETVKIARKRGLNNLSGFMNGVLRTVARQKDVIKYPDEKNEPIKYLSVYYSCPEWIVRMLVDDESIENAKYVLSNSVSVRPLYARVNISKTNLEQFLEDNKNIIEKQGIIPSCVSLHNIDDISGLDAFSKGLITIQDISSMLVGHISGIREDDTVIDVCASPGGKTLHAADIAVNGQIYSCDISEEKLSRIRENVNRCDFSNVTIVLADARNYIDEFDQKADVLIADLPCSGLGVMGRKNDIKYNLSREQIDQLGVLQKQILENVSKYVKPGGIMIFSTCTVSKVENMGGYNYIKEQLGLKPVDFYSMLPEEVKDDTAKKGYLQLYGKEGISDGFFISKFRKAK